LKEGYLTEAGTRKTLRGKQSEETLYGLTFLGWTICLALEKIRTDLLNSLKINAITVIPKKKLILGVEANIASMFPGFIEVLSRVYTQREIYSIVTSLLVGYLRSPTPSFNELFQLPIAFWIPWAKPIINNAAIAQKELLPEGIDRTVNMLKFLDEPKIFTFVSQLLPIIAKYSEEQVHNNMKLWLASAGLYDSLTKSDSQETASIVTESFFNTAFPKLLEQYAQSFKQQEGSS